VGVGLLKTGINRDVYQIGILMFKSVLTVDKVLERTHVERNAVIIGKVIDTDYLPCFAVVNRGR